MNKFVRGSLRGLAVVLAALALGACVPWYDGTPADFYTLPDAPAKEPGTLVRVQKWPEQSNASTNVYRVAYWTKDRRDRAVQATGVVRVPTAAPPAGGTAIGAWDHGTTGLAPQCAPSRTGAGFPTAFLPANIPVAIPDYIGLGPNGQLHSWLAGVSEARATIDLVRATKRIPGVRANGDWWVAGHSQGGHAALFAGEEAAGYAPELHLKGVVAAAPGTELNEPSYITSYMKPAAVMVGAGIAQDYPELGTLEDYLAPAAEAKLDVLRTGCLNEITLAYVGLTPTFDVDPFTNPAFVDLLVDNEPGHQPLAAPVLVVQGNNDIIVPNAYTERYVQRACAQGTTLKYSLFSADHGTVLGAGASTAQQWLAAVAAGQAPPTSCP